MLDLALQFADTVSQKADIVDVTVSELANILSEFQGSTLVSFVTSTEVRMVKKHRETKEPNPYLGARKNKYAYKIIVGFDYEKGVNRRLEKEGKTADFTAKDNWHTAVNAALSTDVRTRSKLYLRYQYQADSVLKSEYIFNGKRISKQALEPYLSSSSAYSNQGLDNPLAFQVVALDNIKQISFNGKTYRVTA